MFVMAERFISRLFKIRGKHNISTDEGTWYPQAKFLKIDHHLIPLMKKALLWRELCNT
jgi:hypothetical protein